MSPEKEQELQESLEFLRGRFEELNRDIKLPHSLDAEVLRARLESLGEEPEEKRGKVIPWRAMMSAAACFVIVLGAVWFVNSDGLSADRNIEQPEAAAMDAAGAPAAAAPAAFGLEEPAENAPLEAAMPMVQAAQGAEEAYFAADYTEIRDTVYSRNKNTLGVEDLGPISFEASPNDGAAEEAAAAGGTRFAPKVWNGGYSGTNVQEEGVDEGDIVKTDGEYLYSYVSQNTTTDEPAIFITDAEKMSVTGKIELSSSISEFYLIKDQLVTVGDVGESLPMPAATVVGETDDSLLQELAPPSDVRNGPMLDVAAWNGSVEATVYSVSDHAVPMKLCTYRQDGSYVSSRLMDGTLYLVSRKNVYADLSREETPMGAIVPVCYDGAVPDGQSAQPKLLPADKIAVAPGGESADYAVVSALDLGSGGADTRAVLGGGDGIYMSADSLYIYYDNWRTQAQGDESYTRTGIVKFSVEDGLRLAGTAYADGYTDGPFAFSEYKGNLRVATTVDYPSGKRQNNLYVFNRRMEPAGSLEGYAPGEQIHSVRYLEETAYIVTFRETDPLFAIDLSDPSNPKVLGQLKIPGFSEYLHPLGDGLLLGIGQDADGQGVTGGLKLSMFDVSDPMNPEELYTYHLSEGLWSEALVNHRAVLFDEERSLFGFAVDSGSGRMVNTYHVFSYGPDGFTLKARISHDGLEAGGLAAVSRGLWIGDTLYTFSPDWIVSYSLKDFSQEKVLRL